MRHLDEETLKWLRNSITKAHSLANDSLTNHGEVKPFLALILRLNYGFLLRSASGELVTVIRGRFVDQHVTRKVRKEDARIESTRLFHDM